MTLCVALDRMADVAGGVAGLDLFDAEIHALASDFHQPARRIADVADEEHAAGVPVVALEDTRHIDIQDITFSQDPSRRWNAVTDDLVDGRTHALGVAAIVQRRRHRPSLHRHFVHPLVDCLGRDPWHDTIRDRVEDRAC